MTGELLKVYRELLLEHQKLSAKVAELEAKPAKGDADQAARIEALEKTVQSLQLGRIAPKHAPPIAAERLPGMARRPG